MNKPQIVATTYCFEMRIDEFLVWDKNEDVFEVLMKFPTVLEVEYDKMYGAFIWVTVNSDVELDRIYEFIYNNSRPKE